MTIFGWDMSNWDSPDIGDAVAEGFAFITHKAGGDTSDGDQELAAWWSGVKGTDPATVLLGTYWVPRPDMYSDPTSEADRWISTIDARCPGWRDRPHMLQIDAERWPQGDQTKPSRSYIKAMADRLTARFPKLRPIVYASKTQYGDSLTGLGYPLWNANYWLNYQTGTAYGLYQGSGGDSGPGWASYSGQTPAIWQFTSSATIAGQTTCDANAFRGTLADLVALVAPGWEVPEVELTDKYGDKAWPGRTVADRLNDDAKLRDVLWGDQQGTVVAKLDPKSPLGQLLAVPGQLTKLTAAVAALPTAQQTADEVLAELAGRSVPEIAAALKAVLGDQAAAVGAALQA